MAQDTPIEWTDKSWNFLRGCSRVSEGCRNCYAERTAVRFSKPGGPYHTLVESTPKGPRWTGKVEFIERILLEPLSWRKPAKVFVNSMSDLFHEDVKDEWLDKAFAVMALTPQHTYQILTKRPERMREYFERKEMPFDEAPARIVSEAFRVLSALGKSVEYWHQLIKDGHFVEMDADVYWFAKWPLPNVWLGVSCEDQKTADERIPLLLQTPAAVRWVSAEPLLGPIDFTHLALIRHDDGFGDVSLNALTGHVAGPDDMTDMKLDWTVVGGESGPGARPFDIAWCGSIVEQCKAAGVPVFVKQLGAKPFKQGFVDTLGNDDRVYLDLTSRKGGDPLEWFEHLRVREYPEVAR